MGGVYHETAGDPGPEGIDTPAGPRTVMMSTSSLFPVPSPHAVAGQGSEAGGGPLRGRCGAACVVCEEGGEAAGGRLSREYLHGSVRFKSCASVYTT